MGVDGRLKDPAGKTINNNNDYYRYNSGTNDSLDIQQQMEEEKRKIEESNRKIKELEKKKKETKPSTGRINSKVDQYEEAMVKSPSLVFSMVRSYL
jgi:peptidoglycan hydrolase CwlO-like protein